MKTITILENTFELPDSSATFLKSYLERLQRFVKNHSLENELYSDIEERIVEKLHQYNENGGITEKNVVQMVNELGEPEEIFKDVIKKSEAKSQKETKKESVLGKPLYRDSKKGMIFGVCQGLGERFETDPVWWRLLFVVSTLFYGASLFVYIILALILPNKGEKEVDVQKNLHEATERIEKIGESGFIKDFFQGVVTFISRVFSGIISFFGTGGNILTKLIIFTFFAVLGVVLLGISIATLIFSSLLQTPLIVGNERVFAHVPENVFLYGLLGGVILLILGGASIAKAFRKTILNGWLVVMLLVGVGVSIFGLATGIFSTLNAYSNVFYKTETIRFSVSQTGVTFSNIPKILQRETTNQTISLPNPTLQVRFEKSESGIVEIETISYIRGNSETAANAILDKLTPLTGKMEGNEIMLSLSGKYRFSEEVPFSFLSREMIIRLPENVSADFKKWGYGNYILRDVEQPELISKYAPYYNCYGSIVELDAAKNRFMCHESEYSDHIIQGIYENYIRENIEDIAGRAGEYREGYISEIQWKNKSVARITYVASGERSRYDVQLEMNEEEIIIKEIKKID